MEFKIYFISGYLDAFMYTWIIITCMANIWNHEKVMDTKNMMHDKLMNT